METITTTKNIDALLAYLAPLHSLLEDGGISEISINEPYAAWIEKGGEINQLALPALSLYWLQGLANLIARYSEQRHDETMPLLSASLPQGHRVQIVIPPACEEGKIIFSIRKQVVRNLSLNDYVTTGAFTNTRPYFIDSPRIHAVLNDTEKNLAALFDAKNYTEFLQRGIAGRKTVLISGGTGTGKTTFLNACIKEIPLYERMLTLEDIREVDIPHKNRVHLLASRGAQSMTNVGMPQLVEASLRLRPDRIIMGEIRGAEAADFINATATGHDGSVASIHASNPAMAFMRLAHMVKLNPAQTQSREDILADLHAIIDIVVQIERIRIGNQYSRHISQIYSAFNPLPNATGVR